MYDEGRGVPRDLVKAHLWYSMAGDNGIRGGNLKKASIEEEMTTDQHAEAQKLERRGRALRAGD